MNIRLPRTISESIEYDSVVDGVGIRNVVFLQGCPHHCEGCHNSYSWDFSGGCLANIDDVVFELIEKANPLIAGITISGGEPFAQPEQTLYLVEKAKEKGLSVWIFSGYTFEQLLALSDTAVQILNSIDVLVDGKFVKELRDISPNNAFKGSTNQRLVDVPKSLNLGKVVIYELK